MTFDDDLRHRFTTNSVAVDGLDAGAQAAGSASARRALVRRVGGGGALMAILFAGFLAIANLGDEQASDLRTADPDVEDPQISEDPIEVPTTAPSEEPTPVPGEPQKGTAIVTVDVDGVVRLNDQVIDSGEFNRDGIAPDDIKITAVDGADGRLVFETTAGVFRDGVLWHKANDARVHDVRPIDSGTLIGWSVPEGNGPSGPAVGHITLDPESASTQLTMIDALAASYGPDDQMLITTATNGCSSFIIGTSLIAPLGDHPILGLSRCLPGEIAEWSSAGHVVLVSSTQEDAWSITVLAADGRSAHTTSPGAFQPQQLDVHTDANGRTQALILGTGEELVYIDVDAFLHEEVPSIAIRGMQNETNLVSARFVDGFEQHPFQAQIDEVIASAIIDPGTMVEQHSLVWAVNNVEADDTLNARSGPGVEFEVVFEFGPNATGVVRTGNDATSTDGATWFEVFSPTSGVENDVGWVNSAFLVEAAVSDTRPCLFDGPQDHYIGIDWTNPEGSADSEAAVISNIETYRFGSCIRTVIEFSDAWSYEDGGAQRVTSLPTDIVVTRDNPPTIDFGSSIAGAEVADARFSEEGGVTQSTFVSMGADRLLDGVLYGGPTTTMWATFDNSNGTLIIDVADIRLPADADPVLLDRVGRAVGPSVDDKGLVLAGVAKSADGDQWTFTGLARPVEANLSLQVQHTDGTPVAVDWINGVVDGQRPDNGVMTTTWTEAWGQFEFTIIVPDGVDPADVVVVFDPSGGAADDPETIDLPLADYLS